MKRFVCLGLAVLIFFGLLGSLAFGQVVRLTVQGDGFTGRATAVCIGECDGGSVFLTARHNFRDAKSARVQIRGQWHRVTRVNESRTSDVASFEVATTSKYRTVGSQIRYGEPVYVGGFGPEYNQSGQAEHFVGTIQPGEINGHAGLHPIVGDSGGPVLQDGQVIGIVSGYVETVARSDYAARAYPTVYVGVDEIHECLSQVYQRCPSGGCPIYLRPQVQQPMIGIGIPVGPPRVVGVATPVPPQPQVYVPTPVPTPKPQPDPAFSSGPRGERGPQGEPGPAGRSVTKEDVESVVNAWLESNIDRIKGPPGDRGPAVGLDAIESRVSALEDRKIRVIVSDGTKVVDDEVYTGLQSDPIVLDIRRFSNVSK